MTLLENKENGISTSEPDLTTANKKLYDSGFPPGVTVDELWWYRKKRPPANLRPRDHIRIEAGSFKPILSEYARQYRSYYDIGGSLDNILTEQQKQDKMRKPLDQLKLEGVQESNPEYYEAYIAHKLDQLDKARCCRPVNTFSMTQEQNGGDRYSTEVHSRFIHHDNVPRVTSLRRSNNLHLEGGFCSITEQADRFVRFLFTGRPDIIRKPTTLKLEGDMEKKSETKAQYHEYSQQERPPLCKRYTNLKLEGDMDAKTTDYKQHYIQYDYERRRPFEKRDTNLHLTGELDLLPVYKQAYVGFKTERAHPKYPRDNIRAENLFLDCPEEFANRSRPVTPILPVDNIKADTLFQPKVLTSISKQPKSQFPYYREQEALVYLDYPGKHDKVYKSYEELSERVKKVSPRPEPEPVPQKKPKKPKETIEYIDGKPVRKRQETSSETTSTTTETYDTKSIDSKSYDTKSIDSKSIDAQAQVDAKSIDSKNLEADTKSLDSRTSLRTKTSAKSGQRTTTVAIVHARKPSTSTIDTTKSRKPSATDSKKEKRRPSASPSTKTVTSQKLDKIELEEKDENNISSSSDVPTRKPSASQTRKQSASQSIKSTTAKSRKPSAESTIGRKTSAKSTASNGKRSLTKKPSVDSIQTEQSKPPEAKLEKRQSQATIMEEKSKPLRKISEAKSTASKSTLSRSPTNQSIATTTTKTNIKSAVSRLTATSKATSDKTTTKSSAGVSEGSTTTATTTATDDKTVSEVQTAEKDTKAGVNATLVDTTEKKSPSKILSKRRVISVGDAAYAVPDVVMDPGKSPKKSPRKVPSRKKPFPQTRSQQKSHIALEYDTDDEGWETVTDFKKTESGELQPVVKGPDGKEINIPKSDVESDDEEYVKNPFIPMSERQRKRQNFTWAGPVECQPEYRRAHAAFLIRERLEKKKRPLKSHGTPVKRVFADFLEEERLKKIEELKKKHAAPKTETKKKLLAGILKFAKDENVEAEKKAEEEKAKQEAEKKKEEAKVEEKTETTTAATTATTTAKPKTSISKGTGKPPSAKPGSKPGSAKPGSAAKKTPSVASKFGVVGIVGLIGKKPSKGKAKPGSAASSTKSGKPDSASSKRSTEKPDSASSKRTPSVEKSSDTPKLTKSESETSKTTTEDTSTVTSEAVDKPTTEQAESTQEESGKETTTVTTTAVTTPTTTIPTATSTPSAIAKAAETTISTIETISTSTTPVVSTPLTIPSTTSLTLTPSKHPDTKKKLLSMLKQVAKEEKEETLAASTTPPVATPMTIPLTTTILTPSKHPDTKKKLLSMLKQVAKEEKEQGASKPEEIADAEKIKETTEGAATEQTAETKSADTKQDDSTKKDINKDGKAIEAVTGKDTPAKTDIPQDTEGTKTVERIITGLEVAIPISRHVSPWSNRMSSKLPPSLSGKIGKKYTSHVSVEDMAYTDPYYCPIQLPAYIKDREKMKEERQDDPGKPFVLVGEEKDNEFFSKPRDVVAYSLYKEQKWMPSW